MIRHIPSSILSVQILRRVESDCRWEVPIQVHVCSGVGDLELVFVPPEAAVSGIKQTCSGVTSTTVHDFVHHADLVGHSPGLQVF